MPEEESDKQNKKENPIRIYEKHEIYLTPSPECRFEVPKIDKSFRSIEEAVSGIDSAIRQLGRVKMSKLNYPVIDSEGENRIITGVHVTTGQITITKSTTHDNGDTYSQFYPDSSTVRDLLSDRKDLQYRMNRVNDCLRNLKIESNYRHQDLAAAYEQLEKDIKYKTKLANKKTKVEMYEEWELIPSNKKGGRRLLL